MQQYILELWFLELWKQEYWQSHGSKNPHGSICFFSDALHRHAHRRFVLYYNFGCAARLVAVTERYGSIVVDYPNQTDAARVAALASVKAAALASVKVASPAFAMVFVTVFYLSVLTSNHSYPGIAILDPSCGEHYHYGLCRHYFSG